MNNVVIYHGPECNDGFCSAWIADKALEEPKLFIPVNYELAEKNLDKLEEVIKGQDVYILDFSFKKSVLEKWISLVNKLVLLDHHKTAKADLEGLIQKTEKVTIVFDMSKAGCRLTWEYFFSKWGPPWFLDYVEDRDLWKWQLKNSKEINAALNSEKKDFKVWESLKKEDLVKGGKFILQYQQQLIEKLVKHAFVMKIGGYDVPTVNSPILQSELGEWLAKNNNGIGAVYYQNEDKKLLFSLRSREHSDGTVIDVSEIARAYGGGGHKQAAGFVLEDKEFPKEKS